MLSTCIGILVSYLSMDWYQTAFCTQQHFTTSSNQLIAIGQCCASQKNSFGLAVASFGCILSFINWIVFIVLIEEEYKINSNSTNLHLSYRLFWVIMIALYLAISIILELYHFGMVYLNAFCMESAVNPGIYGFVGLIARPTFRFIHCFNRYLIMIIWLIFGSKYNIQFYWIIYPMTICSWYISSFFQRSRNRPSPKGICRKIWRIYVEYLYHKACDKQLSINPDFKPPQVRW